MDFWSNLLDTQSYLPTSNSFGAAKNLLAWYLIMMGIIVMSYFSLAGVVIKFGLDKEINLWGRYKWAFIIIATFLASRGLSGVLHMVVVYYPVFKIQVLWANFAALISVSVTILSIVLYRGSKNFIKNMTSFIESYITNSQIKARYKAVADLLESPVFVADKDGKFIYVNRAYEIMLNAKFDDDMRGDLWAQFIYDEDRGRVFNDWERFVASNLEHWTVYARFENRDGDVIPIKISTSYLPTDYGYVGYIQRLE